MWVATLGLGLVSVDLDHARSRRIRHVPAWPMSLADNALRSLYRDHAGLIWVATNRGLSRYDPHQAAVLTRFGRGTDAAERPGDTPPSTEISWVQPLANGQLWLGTHGGGIEVLDESGAQRAAVRPDPDRPEQALPLDIVLAMAPGAGLGLCRHQARPLPRRAGPPQGGARAPEGA
jgi:ligand-binding sensor domain-containing protein